jgi:protein-tyrosine phosphatase
MVEASSHRRLALEGAWNFRDLGGYVGAGGRPVRWRRLFRADGLDRLTAADIEQVAALGLRTVIDLRTGDEVSKGRLSTDAGDVNWHHLPMLDVLPPREDYNGWVGPEYVADQYLAMLQSAEDSVSSFLGLLADPGSYPLVYHCFAGKDRTGVLTALILGLLGVEDHEIISDYALSKLAMEQLLEWLRQEYATNVADIESSAAAIVAAEPETMAMFLSRFRDAYGSFDAYAASVGHAGVGDALRGLLLEPGEA